MGLKIIHAIDNWGITRAHRICWWIQEMTGLISFRLGWGCSIAAAVYWGVGAIAFVLPTELGIDVPGGRAWFSPCAVLLAWLCIQDAEMHRKAEEAWGDGEQETIPRIVAEMLLMAYSAAISIFRVLITPLMLSLWIIVLYADLRQGHGLEFIHDLLYLGWLAEFYIRTVIPLPRGKSKIKQWIEGFQKKPALVPVEMRG